MKKRLILSAVLALFTLTPAQAQWGKWLKGVLGGDQPNQEETSAGLKEALRIGAENAVNRTGRLDGYLLNEAIKILLPEPVRKVERGLRIAGFGDSLDEFVLSMNRAAENAAPEAKEIFWNAVQGMTFQDVYQILRGGDTAATDYFREQTSGSLQEAFLPIVQDRMADTGVTRSFQSIRGRVEAIPFLNLESVNLDQYVVDQALNGLFHILGEEEKKIRTNPAARVTDLLKKVFGSQDSK